MTPLYQNDVLVIQYLKSAITFWTVVLLDLPGCALMFLFKLELFSWYFFSWTSLAECSMFFPSEKNCQLKFWTADISNVFWVSSLQYVVSALYFARNLASPLLMSEPVFCYCEFHGFFESAEFTGFFFVTTVHVATWGEALCLLFGQNDEHLMMVSLTVGFCHMTMKVVVIPSLLYNQTLLK